MVFLNPLLLFGAAAIAPPIVIHLLSQRQIKKVVWAAMRFLAPIIQRNQRRMTLEDLILLVLRCALLLLLALALARPSFKTGGFASGAEAAIVIIDNSASMSQTDGAESRFEKAQKAAGQVLDALPGASAVAVWLASDIVRTSIPEPSRDFALARKVVQNARRTDRGTEMLPALRQALAVLARQSLQQRRIYLITDGQAEGWKQLAETKAMLEEAKKANISARLVIVGDTESRNLAVTGLRIASALAPINEALRFEIEVSNFGVDDARGVPVSLAIDAESPADETTIATIPVGESRHVSLFARFRDAGFHTTAARIAADRNPADDQRVITVRAIDAIDVLLVDGEPGAEARESEVFFLRNALTPVPPEQRERYFIKTRVVSPSEFESVRLPDYKAIVLANVVDLSDTTLESLEKYLRAGGGLVVFPGARISPAFYNEKLFTERAILPARFGPARGDAEQQEQFWHLQKNRYEHPIVSIWKDPAAGTLGTAHFFRAFPLEPDPAARGEGGLPSLVLKYDDGQPAVLERTWGFGRVVQFSSTADSSWNDLAARPAYVPLVHRVLGSLVAREDERLNLRVGAAFSIVAEPTLVGKDATVTTPAGNRETPAHRRIGMVGGVPTIEFDETDSAGAYEVKTSEDSASTIRFATQPLAAESRLTELSPTELSSIEAVVEVTRWSGALSFRNTLQRERTGTEMWMLFAFLALAVAVAETLLGNRFSRSK